MFLHDGTSGADHVVSSSLPGGGTSRWPHSVHQVKSAVLNCFLTDANGSRGGRVNISLVFLHWVGIALCP